MRMPAMADHAFGDPGISNHYFCYIFRIILLDAGITPYFGSPFFGKAVPGLAELGGKENKKE